MKVNRITAVLLVGCLVTSVWCLSRPAFKVRYPLPLKNSINSIKDKLGVRQTMIPILMYHHLAPVGTYEGTHEEDNQAIISVKAFEEQMAYLHDNGYQTIFVSEFISLLDNQQVLPEKTVIITFDDGYESNYIYAYPILKQYALKASINVVVKNSLTESQRQNREAYDPRTLRHMTFTQMKEMVASGLVEIQSHTYDAHGFINVNDKGGVDKALINRRFFTVEGKLETEQDYFLRISQDLSEAKNVLKTELQDEIEIFCYPFGEYNSMTDKAVQASQYLGALTVKPGYVDIKSDRWHIPRINIGPDDTLEDFITKITPL